MSFGTKEGKDTVLFVDKEYVESQTPVEPVKPVDTPEENDQAAAYDPETGEINWDCPCLGGMANGPCGDDFKAAFSCFVYSEAEPKGVDCVEKFKNMQDCFRRHPDVYGDEIDDDDDEKEEQGKPESVGEKVVEKAVEKVEEESTPVAATDSATTVSPSSVLEESESQSTMSWISSWF
ncbi:hypothetical protein J3Q64DRAFT_1765207 [Phycomyces blakesleeanus]|uniref:Mitochondrial intermembrane space import and assembly protein 40 n=2 Tax=Phycomyces blakesleeanus TaxID=4837 RepID=A0A162XGN7_PHYB8|nr:hypothetical protein PHYBLDRAFT_186544 [Phycomyces blakesleeanus NRRL 1555(-)]OAD74755.1 hypothetical protein PHYBLDRAFT_186544 [Phycomyces blakesleeanus NRRL 1555(-)]|eukprot:XP_018292795.1 hypothetical protein PHYBLDRAFT_186544 [Phycomyces blakesleeanus NRRL 1555(-)]